MEWLIWFTGLVLANAATWHAAGAVARVRPDWLISRVLQGIDEDVLMGGAIASAAAILAGQIAGGVPWLSQNWWTTTVSARV